jgi:hypothetical protein
MKSIKIAMETKNSKKKVGFVFLPSFFYVESGMKEAGSGMKKSSYPG